MRFFFHCLVFFVGVFWIYNGIYRGMMFGNLVASKPDQLVVSYVANSSGRMIFPNYTASGLVRSTGQFVIVDIFQDQFKRMESGSTLDIYPLISSGQTNWVNGAKLDESKPIFNIFGFHFSWHLPAGIFLAVYGSLCLLVSFGVLKHKGARKSPEI